MKFSVITPSFRQLDWLAACVASVRDQAAEKAESGNLKAETKNEDRRSKIAPPPLAVEHIIQDAGSPGIEDFARKIAADFYRDGQLEFKAVACSEERVASECGVSTPNSGCPTPDSSHATSPILPDTPSYHISIYCEPDEGMYDAINRGLKRSTGDICSYLNCDEQYLPDALKLVSGTFESSNETHIVTGDCILVREDLQPLAYRRSVPPKSDHLRASHFNIQSSSIFFRRHLIDRGYFFDSSYKRIADVVWMDRLLRDSIFPCHLPQALSAFFFTGKNMGEDDVSANESHAWRKMGGHGRTSTLLLKLQHRVKKALAGAYCYRNIKTKLYSRSNTNRRSPVEGRVGWSWK